MRSLIDFGKIGRPLSDKHVSQLTKVGTEDQNFYFPHRKSLRVRNKTLPDLGNRYVPEVPVPIYIVSYKRIQKEAQLKPKLQHNEN